MQMSISLYDPVQTLLGLNNYRLAMGLTSLISIPVLSSFILSSAILLYF